MRGRPATLPTLYPRNSSQSCGGRGQVGSFMAPSRRCLLATIQEGTCLVSSLRETHPGSTTQMLQEHASRLFRAPSVRTAAMMPPLTSGSWSGAGTATVLKGSRQVGVRTDCHPEVLLHSFQTFTWVCPAGGPWLQRRSEEHTF